MFSTFSPSSNHELRARPKTNQTNFGPEALRKLQKITEKIKVIFVNYTPIFPKFSVNWISFQPDIGLYKHIGYTLAFRLKAYKYA